MKEETLTEYEPYIMPESISTYVKRKAIYVEVIACFLILLFAYTGLSKLIERSNFEAVLWGSPIIESKAKIVSWAVVISELLTVALLIIPKFRRIGLWLSFFLMLAFSLYVTYMMVFSDHRPCSCGGIIQKMSWTQHLIFNWVVTGLTLIALKFSKAKTVIR